MIFKMRVVQKLPWQRPAWARVRNLTPSSVRAPRRMASRISWAETISQRQTISP